MKQFSTVTLIIISLYALSASGADESVSFIQPYFDITAAVISPPDSKRSMQIEVIEIGRMVKRGFYGSYAAPKYKIGDRLTVICFPKNDGSVFKKGNVVKGVINRAWAGESSILNFRDVEFIESNSFFYKLRHTFHREASRIRRRLVGPP